MTVVDEPRTRPAADLPDAGAEILARAQALAPRLRERATEIERGRRLPADIVEWLRDAGVFRMAFSRAWGGPELTSIQQTEVVEALAYGDASAGWCAMIGSDTGLYARFLDEDVAKQMFPSIDMVTAGLLFPTGKAQRVAGGFRLSGRWQFGSGITHADWVVSGAFVQRDGVPERDANGAPDSRLFLVPRHRVEVIDTWHTTGLAGSGSCDYSISDVFVPEQHTLEFATVRGESGPLSQPEVHMRNMPAVPLGVARAALDLVREESGKKADDYRTQVALAECAADLHATRSGVYTALHRQWEVLTAEGTLEALTPQERAALPLSRLHAFRTARSIVQRLYDLRQTSAIYHPSPLDRWLRDTNTMCQHIVAQERILQSAGAYLLGGTPSFKLCLGLVA